MKTLAAIFTMTTAFAEPVPMTFKATDQTEVLYRFAAPEKMEAGKQYPLVLFLHGAGERGTDNKGQLKHGVNDILKVMAFELKKVGSKAKLTMYPGVDHDSWTQTYKDPEAIKWLFAQKKPD